MISVSTLVPYLCTLIGLPVCLLSLYVLITNKKVAMEEQYKEKNGKKKKRYVYSLVKNDGYNCDLRAPIYIILALSVLIFGFGLIACTDEGYSGESYKAGMGDFKEKTSGWGNTPIFVKLLFNNITSAALCVFVGVYAVLSWMSNGMLLGIVIPTILVRNPAMIWLILPHGIIEIPAMILSVSLGLSYGLKLNSEADSYTYLLRKVIPMLIAACIIESFLTIPIYKFVIGVV